MTEQINSDKFYEDHGLRRPVLTAEYLETGVKATSELEARLHLESTREAFIGEIWSSLDNPTLERKEELRRVVAEFDIDAVQAWKDLYGTTD